MSWKRDSRSISATCPICLEDLHRPRILPCSHAFCLLCLQNLLNNNNRNQNYLRKRLKCPACRSLAEIPGCAGVAEFPRSISLENILNEKLSESLKDDRKYPNDTSCIICGVVVCEKHFSIHNNPNTTICVDCGPRVLQHPKKLNFSGEISSEFDPGMIFINNSKRSAISKEINYSSNDKNNHYESTMDTLLNLSETWLDRYRVKRSYSKIKWSRTCKRPSGVSFSPWNNYIYVTGSDACKVFIYDTAGKRVGTMGRRAGQEGGSFLSPAGIVFSKVANEIFVTDKWRHSIFIFNNEGSYLRQIGKRGRGLAEFSSPEGIATDAHGNIYVADTCNDRVQVLDSEGIFTREIGTVSREAFGPIHQYTWREFKEPTGVSVTSDGSIIYVADSGNHRVKVFDGVTGQRIFTVGTKGDNASQFENPECVAVDNMGFFLVGDSGNGRVQVFTKDGMFIRYLGSKGTSNCKGEFGWVSAIDFDKDGKIAVADYKNNAISFF